jgi:hypothetical protein
VSRLTLLLAVAVALVLSFSGTASAKVPKGFYGVVPQDDLSAGDYRSLADGQVATARISFNWAGVQTVPGKCEPKPAIKTCNWSLLDETVANLASVGVRVLPILSGTPGFVSKRHPNKPPIKKKDLSRWRAFVESAAKRYGPGGAFWDVYDDFYGAPPQPITDWQIWNEPNSKQFWHPEPNAKKYARLVKASAKSLRRGGKGADVVLGGMFADAKVPIVTYMNQFYRSKRIGRFFDELAIHPYAPNIRNLKRQIGAARKAARKGAGIRVTELGWSSSKGGHPLNVGPHDQSVLLGKAFRLLSRKRRDWNITGINWFALRDTRNTDTCRFCLKAGLLNNNGNPKPAWRQFKKFSVRN